MLKYLLLDKRTEIILKKIKKKIKKIDALVWCSYLDWRWDFALPLSLWIHSAASVDKGTLPRINSKLKVRGSAQSW